MADLAMTDPVRSITNSFARIRMRTEGAIAVAEHRDARELCETILETIDEERDIIARAVAQLEREKS